VHKEINRRLSIGRMAMTNLEKIMKDRDVKKATKIKIAETIIFPTVTYGSKKIDAFELWTWRRILQVLWMERTMNFSVLAEVQPKRSLEATILRLKLHYVGHIWRY
jgi:hypothetical protein